MTTPPDVPGLRDRLEETESRLESDLVPRLEAAFDSTVRVDDVVYEDLRDGVLTVTVTPVGLGSRIAAAESYDGVDVTTAGSVQIRLHLGEENLF